MKKAGFLGRVRPQLEAAAVDLQIDLQIQFGQADGIGILEELLCQKKQMASTWKKAAFLATLGLD